MSYRSVYDWGLAIVLMGLEVASLRAEDIVPFRVTGVDGYATLRYLGDGSTTREGTTAGSRQQQGDMRAEIFLNGHGFVYHPNFLTLDVGGGPILSRQSFSGESGADSNTATQYNLTMRATLLKDKPFRGSLYFDHLNPTQSIAPGQIMTQENRRYGGEFSLLSPVTPVPLNFAYSHAESKGRGSDRVVDDNTEQFRVRADFSLGARGTTQVQYQALRQASITGASLLPILASRNDSEGLTVDTRLQLGGERAFDLTQLLAINHRHYEAGALRVPDQSDWRLMLDMRHKTNQQLQEFVTVDGSSNHQGDFNSNQRSLAGGLNYRPKSGLQLASVIRGTVGDTDRFSNRTRGANGSVNYQEDLWQGTLQSAYSMAVDWRSQQASSSTVPVLGESVQLSGTQFVALTNEHITTGSVMVSNAMRTQVFVENVDYVLTAVGTRVRVQRLVGGLILDGEQVLVDYQYDVGGTYTYRQVDQSFSLGWAYGRYFNISFRYLNSQPELLSGLSTFPLNPVSSTVWGVRGELPVLNVGWSVGAGVEMEDRRETIAPFRRISSDAYLQNDELIGGFGNLRFGVRRTLVNYGVPTQNVDLSGYDLRYGGRPALGWNLTATANYERDVGGLLPRKHFDAALNAQWRERKLSMTISLMRAREFQGAVERARSLLQWFLRRDL